MQEKYLSREQMQTILDSRPKGVSIQDAVNMYVKNGWTVQGVNEPQSVTEQAKDVAVGFGKGLARTAVNTASGLQTIGQGTMMAAGVPNEVVAQTGFKSLDTSTPEGEALQAKLQPTNDMQKYGGYAETAGEVLAGGGAALLKDAAVGGTKLLAKGVSPVTSGIKSTGKAIYESAFTPNVKEAENILAYEASQPSWLQKLYGADVVKGNPAFKPITTAETALRSGIAGTEKQVGVQAKKVADTLYNKEIAPAVAGIKGVITKDELFAPIQERIAGIVDPTKKAAYQNAFESLMEDYAKINEFSFKDAQALKSELAQFTPAKVFRGQDVANETRMMQSDMANLIRQKTYEALKDVNIKQKYLDYGNLQELQKVGVKAISDAGFKGGFGGFWSTVYDKAMTPVKTVGGKVIYHIGDKLQVAAPKGFEGKSFADYLRSVGYLAPQVGEKSVEQSFKLGAVPKTVKMVIDAIGDKTRYINGLSYNERVKLYNNVIKPQLAKLPKVKDDEVVVFHNSPTRTLEKGNYVSTNPEQMWMYAGDDTIVKVVKKKDLSSTGFEEKDAFGERFFK